MSDILKGYLGKEDFQIQTNTGAAETFERKTSVGGTMNLTKMPDIWTGTGKINVAEVDIDDDGLSAIHKTSHQNGGSDEINVIGLSGLLADDQHVLDAEVLALKGIANGIASLDAVSMVPKIEMGLTYANIKRYGAVGNGTIDDLTAIQAAVNSADVIYFPRMENGYAISGPVVLTTNKKLVGDGKFSSILKALTNSQAMISTTYGTLTRAYIEISNLGLNANTKTAVKGIVSTLASALIFKDLFFAGLDYTFYIDRGNTILVQNILNEGLDALLAGRVQFFDSSGVTHLQHLVIDNYETRNIGSGVQTPALLLDRVAPAHIKSFNGNDFTTGSAANGILIQGDCQGVTIAESIIVKPQKGVEVKTWAGAFPTFLNFSNVDIDQPQVVAYQLTNGNYIAIHGGNLTGGVSNAVNLSTTLVSIDGLEISTFASNGIVVSANIGHFKILNNRIYNITGTAIIVSAGTSDYYLINHNDCSVGNGGKISDGGTGANKYISENL